VGRLSPKRWRGGAWYWSAETVDGLSEAFLQSRSAIAGHLAMQGMVVWHGNPSDVLQTGYGKSGENVLLVNNRVSTV